MKTSLGFSVVLTLLTLAPSYAFADDAVDDPDVSAIQKKYQDKIASITEDADKAADAQPSAVEKTIGIQVIAKKVRHTITVKYLKLKAKMTTVAFSVPEIQNAPLKTIHYQVPEVHTELRTVGKYPEINKFRVKMKDIRTNIPVVTMVGHDVKLNVPRLGWRRIEIKTLLPVPDGTETLTIVYDLPDVSVHEAGAAKTASDQELASAQKGLDDLVSAEQSEIKAVTVTRLTTKKDELSKTHDDVMKSFEQAIESVRAAQRDPKDVVLEDGSHQNLEKEKQDADTSFHEALRQIDEALTKLS